MMRDDHKMRYPMYTGVLRRFRTRFVWSTLSLFQLGEKAVADQRYLWPIDQTRRLGSRLKITMQMRLQSE